MADLSSLSDAELVQRLPGLVRAEGHVMAEVIEHLVEVERRRLYMTWRITSLLALIAQETRKRFGAGKPRKARVLKPGSRHVPVAIQRAVWERDGSQCTFVDSQGCRCAERRILTLEHRTPFALGGPPTLENLCLLSWGCACPSPCRADFHVDLSAQAITGTERRYGSPLQVEARRGSPSLQRREESWQGPRKK